MAEPTSALSFYDLILRVAKEAGIAYYGSGGNEPAMIPLEVTDFALCKDIVNDGIRMFIADAPAKGWRWMKRIMSVTLTATRVTGTVDAADADDNDPATTTTLTDATLETDYGTNDDLNNWYIYILTGTGAGSYAKITDYTASGGVVTVADWLDEYGNPHGTYPVANDTFCITPVETVSGNISRYPLAENFGGEVNGPIEYEANSAHGTHVEWCGEAAIRARRSVTVHTGYPTRAAIRPFEYKGSFGPKRRFELIVDPQPSAAEVLEFPYTVFFDELRMVTGNASSVASGTDLLDTALDALYPDDYFNTWKIKIISGTGKNSYALVDNYVGSTAKFVVVDWLFINGNPGGTDPAANSVYVAEPAANLHPAGLRFDQAVLAACLAQAEMEVEDITAGFVEKYMKKALPQAWRIDTRSAPRKLGSLNLQRRGYYGRQSGRSDVTTDHDL